MASSCLSFSLAAYKNQRLKSLFEASGLRSRMTEVEAGTILHCWMPEEEEGSHCGEARNKKPALMLIHGFGTNSLWQWSSQVRFLHAHFRLYVPDLLFWGKSSTKSEKRSEIFQAEVMVKLMRMLDVPTFFVAGTSYGGFVAFWMAQHFPDAVSSVVIANSGICMNEKDSAGLLQRAKMENVSDLLLPQSPAAVRNLMRLSLHQSSSRFIPNFVLNDFLDFFYRDQRTERVELLNNTVVGSRDDLPLPILKQKVLIIWGDHDGIFLPALADRLKKHLGDAASLQIMKGCAHCVQQENPIEFNELLLNFLLQQ